MGTHSFDSLIRQIHIEWLKAKSQSLIYNFIYNSLPEEDDDLFDNPQKLLNVIRLNSNDLLEDNSGDEIPIGEYINRYHEQP